MNIWIENYLGSLLISVLMTGLIIPKILLIAFRKKLFDSVDERKIHRGAVPRLGGIAFLPSILLAIFLTLAADMRLHSVDNVLPDAFMPVEVLVLVCSLLLLFLVGIADDLIGVRYRAKFIFQILCGVLLVASGLWISNLYGFFGIGEWPSWLGWFFTILLIVYVANAINLIDGIDGLASGLSIIALAFYSYVLFMAGSYINAVICAAALGTLLPFFYYNVFGKSAKHTKIFMGDTGSLTIGMILGYMSLIVFNLDVTAIPANENVVVLALAPIMLPCLDVVRVFFHRLRNGNNPFLPDKCHIHHKLLALGMVQWKALIIILAADALLIMINLLLSAAVQSTWIILGDVLIWTMLNMLLTHLIRVREQQTGKKLYS